VTAARTVAAAPAAPEPVHPAIAAALGALDQVGVRWCLLRGEADLRDLGGDVDLLIDRRDLRLLRRTLVGPAGFARLPAWGRGPHRFFVARIGGEDAALKLDVVTELCFGRYHELRTRTAAQVLARRRRDNALARPAPADEFWALLLHALLDRAEVRPAHARALAALSGGAQVEDGPLSPLVDLACPRGWDAARVAGAAAAGRFAELEALAPALRAGWPGAGHSARARLAVALRRIDRRLPRRRGAQHSGRMTSRSRSRSAG
jgi:hypothetical protein